MRLFTIVFCILIFSVKPYSQDLVKRIDSLIYTAESSGNILVKNLCDTFFASHSAYLRFDCAEYYSFENKLIKIVNKKGSIRMFNFYDSLPGKTGITSFDTFYFYNDTLIKAIRRDYDPNPVTISHFYFAGDDLVEMEKRGLKWTDEYKRAEYCIRIANESFNNFKRSSNN